MPLGIIAKRFRADHRAPQQQVDLEQVVGMLREHRAVEIDHQLGEIPARAERKVQQKWHAHLGRSHETPTLVVDFGNSIGGPRFNLDLPPGRRNSRVVFKMLDPDECRRMIGFGQDAVILGNRRVTPI